MKTVFRTSLLGLAGAVCAGHAALAADLPSTIAPPALAPAPLFLFEDTSVGAFVETGGTDPGVTYPNGKVAYGIKEDVVLTHVDAFAYGTNFVKLFFINSSHAMPAGSGLPGIGLGNTELFAVYEGTLSGNALTHSKAFTIGPVKDISLFYGFTGDLQNDAFISDQRVVKGGLQIAFDVPGFLTLSAFERHEWQHNNFDQYSGPGTGGIQPFADYNQYTGEVSYKVAPAFEIAYSQPLGFTGLPLSVSGLEAITLPKGNSPGGVVAGVGGYNPTTTEYFFQNQLNLDIGSYVFHRPKFAELFAGYRLWLNKFGNVDTYGKTGYLPASHESEAIVGVNFHLF